MHKRIPYGISNYQRVKTENYYFIDKSKYIESLENYGSPYQFFLRPRRFGKSLFVSMLSDYYDINCKDKFNELFGDTYIGKHPTKLRNTYPILKFNLSAVKTFGTIDEIRKSFISYIHAEVMSFIKKYEKILQISDEVVKQFNDWVDIDIVRNLLIKIRERSISVYLIIDEYDNFANNILAKHGEATYKAVTHSGGFLRNFFTNIKFLTDNREIDRLFITGVSPLVMADVTSGFNIGYNISQNLSLADMVGISQTEINDILDYYYQYEIFDKTKEEVKRDFDKWYDGYYFNEDMQKIYNTTLVMYYLQNVIINKKTPINLIDENLRTDYGKFRFLLTENNKLNGNFSVLKEIVDNKEVTAQFIRSFALNDIIEKEKFVSLLFYLGFLSFKAVSPLGFYTYKIPNKLVDVLLWEFVQKSLTDVYDLKIDRYFLSNAFRNMSEKGEWKPVLEHILERFYEAVSFRDFVFHEEGVKMFVLAWLNLAIFYKIYSEKEPEKGYSDIYIEPEPRYGNAIKYGFIIEMKYIKAEHLKSKNKAEAAIAKAIEEATTQLKSFNDFEGYGTKKVIIVASAKKLLYMGEVQ